MRWPSDPLPSRDCRSPSIEPPAASNAREEWRLRGQRVFLRFRDPLASSIAILRKSLDRRSFRMLIAAYCIACNSPNRDRFSRTRALQSQTLKANGFNSGVQASPALSRIDKIQSVEPEVVLGNPHGFGDGWLGCVLDFIAGAPAVFNDKQVEIRLIMGPPEIDLFRIAAFPPDDLFKREAFPTRPKFGVMQQFLLGVEPEKGVVQTGIAEVNLGRFYLALSEVLIPWRKPPDHERAREDVQVMADGVAINAHGF